MAAERLPTNIIEEWETVQTPPPPKLERVTVVPSTTALLILDMQKAKCSSERRPRCVATLPALIDLLERARASGMPVVHSIARRCKITDIRAEVAPNDHEPVVSTGVDKFYNTQLDALLKGKSVQRLIITGTSAHGAVLHTATAAALRHYQVIVPVDTMSSDTAFAEKYTAWHLANSPGTRHEVVLTLADWINIG